MADPNIRIKRSSVAGKRPTISQLELGELALNTNDGRLFTRKYNVGIGSTVTLLSPWTENIGGGLYYTEGNIGIGLTNPTAKLDVAGDVNVSGVVTATTFYGDGSNITGLSTFSGDYNDLLNQPSIPTDTGDLTNNAGFITATSSGSSLTGIVTTITAGSGISVDQSTGNVTITATGGGGGGAISIKDEGSILGTAVTSINFVGSGVIATGDNSEVTVTIDGGGGSNITIQDEESVIGTAATTINFVGSGVSASYSGGITTVTVSSTGGGSISTAVGISKSVISYIATEGQTTFSATYNVGFVDVFLNGAKLSEDQYTASDGTSIVLDDGASLNDVIEIIGFGGILGVGIATAGGTVGTGVTLFDFRGPGISTVTVSSGIGTINITGGTVGIHPIVANIVL